MFNTLPDEVVYLILEYVDFGDLLHLKLVTKVPLFDVIQGRALAFRSRYEDATRHHGIGVGAIHSAQRTVRFLEEGKRSFYYISSVAMRGCGFPSCRVFRRLETFLAGEQWYTAAKLIKQHQSSNNM